MRNVERNGWRDRVNWIFDKFSSISMFENEWIHHRWFFFKQRNQYSYRFRHCYLSFLFFIQGKWSFHLCRSISRPESWRKEVNSTALNGFVSNSTSREILLSFGCLWIVNLFNEFASLAANERKRSRHYFNNFSYLSREISDSSGIILIRWNGIFRRLIILPYSI